MSSSAVACSASRKKPAKNTIRNGQMTGFQADCPERSPLSKAATQYSHSAYDSHDMTGRNSTR